MTPETKRLTNECLDSYLLRLGNNKDLYNLTWPDIAEEMNEASNEDFGESKWRKDYHQLKRGYELAIKNKITENEALKEIEDKTLELEKKTYQFRDQKREHDSKVRMAARFENLKNEIHKSIVELENMKPLRYLKPLITEKPIKRAILLLSDLHFGADFSNSLNTYNPTIFRKRIEQLVEKFLLYTEKNGVTDITLANLGDQVNGLIHVSSRVQASEDVIRQTQVVSEVLAEMTAMFSGIFKSVRVINICGNHARTIPNKTESVLRENFEKLIPWYLESRLRDFTNVEILTDSDGYYVDDVDGEKFVYVHGDLDYVTSAAKALPQMLGIVPKLLFSGHIHHNHVKEHGRTTHIVSGSLMGVDDYAISKRFYAEPMQKLLILDGSEIECTYDIKLK